MTVGDKNQTVNTQLGEKTVNTAEQIGDRIEEQSVVNYVQNISPWFLFIMLLGWILPTPTNIFKGFINLIKMLRKKDAG